MIKHFNEYLRESIGEDATSSIELQKTQLSYGDWVEYNIKAAIDQYGDSQYVKRKEVSKEIDFFFGADALLEFSNEENPWVDGMTQYVDISTKEKIVDYYFDGNNGVMTGPKSLCQINNFDVVIGIKTRNGSRFRYKKPVLVVSILKTMENQNPLFSQNDVFELLKYIRWASYFVAYKMKHYYGGEWVEGCGKLISHQIDTNERRFEQ